VLAAIGQALLAILLLSGCLLALFAAIGLHRLPDVFCRMHAATKPATLGLLLIALAVGVWVAAAGAVVKLLLVVVLQFLTTPVAAHMVGRAAYRSGSPLAEVTVMDELGRAAGGDRYGPSS
jgi:multicomponent Na+:H+ antiporter subunit G